MCKRRDCLNNYCTKYYTSHKYLIQLSTPFHAYRCYGRPSVQDYILRRVFAASTSASSAIVTWAWALCMTGSWICMTRRRASTSRHVRFRTRWRASTRAVRKHLKLRPSVSNSFSQLNQNTVVIFYLNNKCPKTDLIYLAMFFGKLSRTFHINSFHSLPWSKIRYWSYLCVWVVHLNFLFLIMYRCMLL